MNEERIESQLWALNQRVARIERRLELDVIVNRQDAKDAEDAKVEERVSEAEVCPELFEGLRQGAEGAKKEEVVGEVRQGDCPALPVVRQEPVVARMPVSRLEVKTEPQASIPPVGDRCHKNEDRCHQEDGLVSSVPAGAKQELHAPVVARREPCSPRNSGRSWEMLIGMNWMAWAGSILVVLAVGFFVKLAYDQGWLGRLPDQVKCLLSATFGFALLFGGEIARRRVGRVAAASLFGAGLGALYLTAFATFRWFNLLDETGAFWLLLLVALIGFAITIHARLITTGVLALVGGYLTPILLKDASSFPGALPLYLTMLLGLALALSAWRERPFRVLRYVALCLHAVVGALWAFHNGPAEWQFALIFMGLWWVMVNGEGIYAAIRGQSPLGNPIASLFVTVWVCGIGHWLLEEVQPGGRDWLGLFTVVLAGLAAVPAAAFGPGIKVLQHRPKRAMEKLGVALWAQTAVLLATAIGFQFEDFGQTIGWLVLGLACVEVGRRLPSRGVDWFGLGVGALALARVAFYDSHLSILRGIWWQFGDVRITYWGMLAAGAVLTTYVSALRLQVHGSPPRKRLPVVLMGLGTFGWVIVCLTQCDGLAATWGWLAAAVVLITSDRFGRRHRCFEFGGLLAWLSAIVWLLRDAAPMMSPRGFDPTATLPVLNELFLVAVVIAGMFGWMARVHFVRSGQGLVKPYRWYRAVICGVLFVMVALSFQLEHLLSRVEAGGWQSIWPPEVMRYLWKTLLWAAGGLTVALTAAAYRRTPIVYVGLSMLGLAVGAWLSVDTLLPRMERGIVTASVVANLQFAMGALLAVMLAVVAWRLRAREGEKALLGGFAEQLPPCSFNVIMLILLWAGTLEIDRFHAVQFDDFKGESLGRGLGWLLLWTLGGLVMTLVARRQRWAKTHHVGFVLMILTTVGWLSFCTLVPRVSDGVLPVRVLLNSQFLVGATIAGVIAFALWRLERGRGRGFPDEASVRQIFAAGCALLVAIGLWLGSLELDRFFAPEAGRVSNAAMARQTALSIFWGCYAIGLIIVGFSRREAWARYAGLGLLTVTLGKVLIIDMKEVEYVYRVLSFLGVGLLLMGTSVAYAKLSQRLLGEASAAGRLGSEATTG